MKQISSNKKTAITFIVVFVICVVLGNLFSGDSTPLDTKGFYSFFYYSVPMFLGAAAGIPVDGVLGSIFTLIASVVLMVMSVKMTDMYTDDGECDFLGRIVSYAACYIFFTIASTVMIKPSLVFGFLNHKFLLAFPIIFLLGFIVLTFLKMGKKNLLFWKRLNYFLSSLGFSVSIAGFSDFILNAKLEQTIVIPSRTAELLLNIARNADASVFQGVALLLIQAVLALLVLYFLNLANEDMRLHYSLFGLLTIILFWCHSPLADTNVFPQGLKYWILLLALVFVYAKQASTYKLSYGKTFISGLGLIITLPSLYYSLVFFYAPVNNSFNTLIKSLLPVKTALLGFVNGIFPLEDTSLEMSAVAMVAVTVAVVIVAALLYLPLKGKKTARYGVLDNPHQAIFCSLAFLVGVIVKSCGFTHHIILKIAYGIIAVSVIAGVCMFGASIKVKEKKATRNHLYAFVVTLILLPVCSSFAQGVGLVVSAVILGIILLVTVKENLDAPETKGSIRIKRLYNMGAYAEAIDQLNEQIESGEKSHDDAKKEALAVAAIARDNDRELKKRLDNLD